MLLFFLRAITESLNSKKLFVMSDFVNMSAGWLSVVTWTSVSSFNSTASLKMAHSIPKCFDLLWGVPKLLARVIEAVLSS